MTENDVNIENFIKKYYSLVKFIYRRHFGACIPGATREDVLSHGLEAIEKARVDFCEKKGDENTFVYGYILNKLRNLKTFFMREKRKNFSDISIYDSENLENEFLLKIENRDMDIINARVDIERAMKNLTECEKNVISLLLQDHSMEQISKESQRSKQRIWQLILSAKRKMKLELEKVEV